MWNLINYLNPRNLDINRVNRVISSSGNQTNLITGEEIVVIKPVSCSFRREDSCTRARHLTAAGNYSRVNADVWLALMSQLIAAKDQWQRPTDSAAFINCNYSFSSRQPPALRLIDNYLRSPRLHLDFLYCRSGSLVRNWRLYFTTADGFVSNEGKPEKPLNWSEIDICFLNLY